MSVHDFSIIGDLFGMEEESGKKIGEEEEEEEQLAYKLYSSSDEYVSK